MRENGENCSEIFKVMRQVHYKLVITEIGERERERERERGGGGREILGSFFISVRRGI